MSKLHILNGDSTRTLFEQTSIVGDVIVWRECLSSGPCHQDVGSEIFLQKRAEFLKTEFGASRDGYLSDFTTTFDLIKGENYDDITLWFEYDLFCIINMFAALSFLKNNEINKNTYLVDLRSYQQKEKYIGLTEIDVGNYEALCQNRLPVSKEDLALADHLWKSHCNMDYSAIGEYLNYDKSPFFYLGEALLAHQFVHKKHEEFSQLDRRILDIISDANPTHKELVQILLSNQSIIGYGDLQYEMHIKKLSAHYVLENGKYHLIAKTD